MEGGAPQAGYQHFDNLIAMAHARPPDIAKPFLSNKDI
jgi:hypothetical protein